MNRKYWVGAFIAVLVLSLAWGLAEKNRADNLKTSVENQYRHSFSDFVTSLDSLETNLSKSRAASTPTQQVYYLGQCWLQSDVAVKNLASLPAEEIGISYADRFINQIGEFTRLMTQRAASGTAITSDQEKTLKDMHTQLIDVNRQVQDLNMKFNTEDIIWVDKKRSRFQTWLQELRDAVAAAEGQEGPEGTPGSVRGGLQQLDASLQKLPPFSYEGQGDTQTVQEPLGLAKKQIDQEQSHKIASDFLNKLGYSGIELEKAGQSNGPFSAFIWKKDNVFIDVTEQGGVISLFRDERSIENPELDVDQAVSKTITVLKELGWTTFIKTSTEDFGNYIILDAVLEENGIRIYPDKLRLMVAKDNGKIVGYDATAYWAYHHPRKFNKKLTLEQAQKILRPGIEIKENRLAIIPKSGNQEAFCYEFRGSINGEDYLIYINAANGREEKLQRIIKTPRGEYLE